MPHPINRAIAPAAPMDQGDTAGRTFVTRLSGWLISGTRHFSALTAIAAGLVVLALAFSGPSISQTASQALYTADWTQLQTWAALLLKTGLTALTFLTALVAAYVAYGIADRPAVIPGLLGGMAAMGIEAGALGGLLAGLLAGTITRALQRITVPAALRHVASTVLLPLLTTVMTAFLVVAVAGAQLRFLNDWLQNRLATLEFQNGIVFGLVLGTMVCCDLGGVFTKSAISFGAVMLSGDDPSRFSTFNMTIMATVVAAGMVPPMGLALATVVRRKLFTAAERDYGRVAWLFGAAFLPEGVAPFALADPLRVIPASMAGGAVTGALAMHLGTTIPIPYGGVFGADKIGEPLLFATAVFAGVLTTAATAIGLKSLRSAAPAKAHAPATSRTSAKVRVTG